MRGMILQVLESPKAECGASSCELRQKDCCEFEGSLGCIVRFRPSWATG